MRRTSFVGLAFLIALLCESALSPASADACWRCRKRSTVCVPAAPMECAPYRTGPCQGCDPGQCWCYLGNGEWCNCRAATCACEECSACGNVQPTTITAMTHIHGNDPTDPTGMTKIDVSKFYYMRSVNKKLQIITGKPKPDDVQYRGHFEGATTK